MDRERKSSWGFSNSQQGWEFGIFKQVYKGKNSVQADFVKVSSKTVQRFNYCIVTYKTLEHLMGNKLIIVIKPAFFLHF